MLANNKLAMYRAEVTREYMSDNLFSKYVPGADMLSELVATGRASVKTTYVEPVNPKPVENRGPQLRDLIFED